MTKPILKISCFVIVIIIAASFQVYASMNTNLLTPEEKAYVLNKKSIRVGVLDNEHPYSFYSNGKIMGLSIDVLHVLEQICGLKFNFVMGSWSNVFSSFQKGELDVIDEISFTEERRPWILFTPPYHIKKLVLFMRSSDVPQPFLGLKSLKGKRVGVIKGIYYVDALKRKDGIEIHEYADYISLMKALSFGWIDAVVSGQLTGRYIAHENNLSGLVMAGPLAEKEITEEDYRLGISKKNPVLHSILVKSLKSVPKQTLEKLKTKWRQYPLPVGNSGKISFTQEETSFIADHPVITMGMLRNFSPYSFVSQDRPIGYTASLLELISEKTGLEFSYVVDDWARVFYLFRTGQLDAISNISYTEDRIKFTRYSDAYHIIPTVIFVRNGFSSYKNMVSLKGRRVGITKDVFYKNKLAKAVGPTLQEFTSHADMLKALSLGELDAVVDALNTGNNYIQKLELDNLRVAGELDGNEVRAEDLHFGIRPDLVPLDAIINKALRSMAAADWQRLESAWLTPQMGRDSTHTVHFSEKETAFLKSKKKLILCPSVSEFPFGKMDKDGRYIGIGADFMKVFAQNLPIPITFDRIDRQISPTQLFKQDKCDIGVNLVKTQDKEKYMDFTDPYLVVPYVVATSVNAPFIDDFRNFLDRSMGVVKGNSLYEQLKMRYPDLKLVEVDNELGGIYKVQRGQLFGFIGTMTSIGYHLRQEKIVDIKIAGKLPFDCQLSIATRKNEPMLGEIFQKLVASVSDNDKKQLLDPWLSVKVEQKFDYTPFWKILGIFFILVLISLFWIQKVRKLNQKLLKANNALKELSNKDGLTGLYNRRFFDEQIKQILETCKRCSANFSFIMFDIDFFKKINDTYGHPAGDECLKQFSSILVQRFQRKSDIVCRFGGEEFAVICTDKTANKVKAYVEEVRIDIKNNMVLYEGKKIKFTISAGIYSTIPGKDLEPEQYLTRADQALYKAKNSGRNRVVQLC